MITSLATSAVNPAHLTPEQIADSPVLSERDKLSEMSRQFEAVLLRQILTEAHKPVFKSSMSLGSAASSVHQDLLISEMAKQMTQGPGTGLATQLTRDLGRQFKSEASTEACERHANPPQSETLSTGLPATTSSQSWIR